MKNIFYSICFLTIIISVESCNTKSNMVLYEGVNLTNYKFIVFNDSIKFDSIENDLHVAFFPFVYWKKNKHEPLPIRVKNEITKYFKEVNINEASEYADNGELVLSPDIKTKVEFYFGGYTYITVSFFDYHTNKLIAEINSRGVGSTSTASDKIYALKGIRRELAKLFK